ncbi:MAG: sigma 54-interacting transcriptional regulator [Gemmatimonadetes bacterium]|nr:sigma 54-interacting transcriptional regulator [Gemmatimonadota bacterium]
METLFIPGFDLLESIGRGRSGEVWRARRLDGGETVAVKVAHASPRHGADEIDFKLEYQTHSRFRHPHIVAATHFGEIDELHRYYVMEYVPQVDLGVIYRKGGLDALGEVALAVCSALEYAHAQGILHGDIKPANILVSAHNDGSPDRVLLADFGYARRRGVSRQDVTGTLAYLPPEVMTSPRVDPRSDLYSLGATLFEAIAGRPLFDSESPEELLDRLGRQDTPSIEPFLDDDGWRDLVDALTARRPEDRPRSATVVADLVSDLLGHGPNRNGDARPLPYLGSPLTMIARDQEFDRALTALGPGGPRAILVTGAAGVGKTRFVESITHTLGLEGVEVLHSDARESADGAFRVLQNLFRYGRVRGEFNLPAGGRVDGDMTTLAASFLESLGPRGQSRLFVFESLESADPDSLVFLQALHRSLDSDSALCLVARDGDAGESISGIDSYEEIHLAPFEPLGTRLFITALLGEADRPDRAVLEERSLGALVDWIDREAGGNAAKIEAAMRRLVEDRVLDRSGGAWTLAAGRLERIASSGKSATKRLHHLGLDSEQLMLAAVAAPAFDPAVLTAASADKLAAAQFLHDVVHRGIVTRGHDRRYRFAEPDLQRDIYSEIPESKRRAMHARIAELLREHGETPTTEIARHLEFAGDREAARDAWSLAAASLRQEGAVHGAARAWSRSWMLHSPAERSEIPNFVPEWIESLLVGGGHHDALALCDELIGYEPEGRIATRLAVYRAQALDASGQQAHAADGLQALVDRTKFDDPGFESWTRAALGALLIQAGHSARAEEQLRLARDRALDAEIPREAGRAEHRLGHARWRAGDVAGALDWLSRAEAHLNQASDTETLPLVWGLQAVCLWDNLDILGAAAAHRRAAEGLTAAQRPQAASRSFRNLAFVLIELGRWDEAESALAEADRLVGDVVGPRDESFQVRTRGVLAWYRADFRQAREHAQRAIDLVQPLHDAYPMINHLVLSGLVDLDRGETSAAETAAKNCLSRARAVRDVWGQAFSHYLLGCVHRQRKNAELAEAELDSGLEALRERRSEVRFRIQLERAELLAGMSGDRGADMALRDAREMAECSRSPLWRALYDLTSGRIHAARADHEAALVSYLAALRTFESLGARFLHARTLEASAASHRERGNDHAALASMRSARQLREEIGIASLESRDTTRDDDSRATLHTVDRVLEAAAAVSKSLTKMQTVDEVAEKILEAAMTYLGTERGVIALEDPTTRRMKVRCHRNIDPDSMQEGVQISIASLEAVGTDGEIIHSGDALSDPRLSLHESIRKSRIRSLVAMPIRWGGRILGALYMDHRSLTDLFGPEALRFLSFIADMAAIGIHNARQYERFDEQRRTLQSAITGDPLTFSKTVLRDPEMRRIVSEAIKVARAGQIILLTGPSGCGKDHFAKILHDASRLEGDFVHSSLPDVPEALVQSGLFGVVQGAATGVERSAGLIHQADGGTLFLNEFAEIPVSMQTPLLQFLDTFEYRPVGSVTRKKFNGLLIFATNADLQEKIRCGTFRKDIYYRMQHRFALPSLRERPDDILSLAELFLEKEHELNPSRPRCHLTSEAQQAVRECRWDGNVRELRDCISDAVRNADGGDEIRLEHLSRSIIGASPQKMIPRERGSLEEAEIQQIREAMARAGGVIKIAARLLGLKEGALTRRLDKHDLRHLQLRRRRKHSSGEPA